MQTSEVVLAHLLQYYKWDFLYIGNCSVFHLQRTLLFVSLLDHLYEGELQLSVEKGKSKEVK